MKLLHSERVSRLYLCMDGANMLLCHLVILLQCCSTPLYPQVARRHHEAYWQKMDETMDRFIFYSYEIYQSAFLKSVWGHNICINPLDSLPSMILDKWNILYLFKSSATVIDITSHLEAIFHNFIWHSFEHVRNGSLLIICTNLVVSQSQTLCDYWSWVWKEFVWTASYCFTASVDVTCSSHTYVRTGR